MALPTVIDLLQRSASFLEDRGSPSPRVDAEMLLAHVLGCSRTQLYMNHNRPMTSDEVDGYRELIRRRATREPVAYILGTRGFWTLDLEVTPAVLIPRPETERLVELVLDWIGERREHPWRIVDVGTGSGAIALALASELPEATVLALDISDDALEVAARNADAAGVRDRVRLRRSDLLAALGDRAAAVDIVVSNPPYVTTGEMRDLEPDVRSFEPTLALEAGSDGLDVIRRLVPQAARALVPGGLLAFEIGAHQGDAARAVAATQMSSARVAQDYAGLDRVVLAERGA